MSGRKRGFTLTELLVVIAMMALLGAILLPVFAQARAQARKAGCQSNFKQLAAAVLLYCQDYDERYPILVYHGGCARPQECFHTLLQPYARNDTVLACPADPASKREREETDPNCAGVWPPEEVRRIAYATKSNFGVNSQYFCPFVWSGTAPSGTSLSVAQARVGRPAETIFAVDSIWYADKNGTPYGGGTLIVDPPCRYRRDGADSFPYPGADVAWQGGWHPYHPVAGNDFGWAWPWHHGRVNVAWADGHVTAKRIEALAAGCDVKDRWMGSIYAPEEYLWDLE